MAFTINEIDPEQNPALAELEQKTGPSNFYRVMAHWPQAMQDFSHLYGTLMGAGSIDARLKEMVYLAVSTVNESAYCTASHLRSAHRIGLTDQDIEDIRAETNQHFSPKEQAALHYARELTRTAAAENDTRDALENLFSAEQLVELTLVISLANFTNRFNNGLAVRVEKHQTA